MNLTPGMRFVLQSAPALKEILCENGSGQRVSAMAERIRLLVVDDDAYYRKNRLAYGR